MPVVKVTDLAYCRLQSPDLDVAQEFLTRFGMTVTARTQDRLFMRGTDPQARIHVTHLGESKCIGLAFHVAGEDDLRAASKLPGASGIENVDEPGGGKRVRFKDPMGYQIELITAMQPVAKLSTRRNVLKAVEHGPVVAMQEFIDVQQKLSRSEDAAEGVRSFVERRAARFSGR